MAGILDKKSRLFDYQLTVDGRRQTQNNDLRFVYASFCDSSIVYYEDEEKRGLFKNKIDNSDSFYLPLESTAVENSTLVNEFKFNANQKSYTDFFDFNITNSDIISSSLEKVSEISVGNRIKNQGILLKKSGLSPETFSFKVESPSNEKAFNFQNTKNIIQYPTILNEITSVKNLEPIYNDKRFSNKINFMKLSPVNSFDEKIFEDNLFNGLEDFNNKSNIDFMFRNFGEKVTFQNEADRESTISDLIEAMSVSKEFFKKEYTLVEEDNIDTLFLEMFEISSAESSEVGKLEKLLFIKAGEIFSKYENSYKDVYLIGKIKYNNRELENETIAENDKLKRVEQGLNNESGYKFVNYLLSNYYSFVNMFVIVAE